MEPYNYSLKDSAIITWQCDCCKKIIDKEHELWVKEDGLSNVYHFSCYNVMKAKEQEKEKL